MNLESEVKYIFCENFKDKIVENESYDAFISSFSKNKIENIYKIFALMENDGSKLANIVSLSLHPKSVILNDFKKNNKIIYKSILFNSYEDIVVQMSYFLKEYNGDSLIIDLSNSRYSLHFFEFLNYYNIAKINYKKNKNKLYLYSPIELRNILKEILKDKSIMKKSKNNTMFKNRLFSLVSTYGVLKLKDLCKIYNKIYDKINANIIMDMIIKNMALDKDINLVKMDKDYLVYGLSFNDDDDAFSFYYSLQKDLNYKVYKKEEYESILEGTYHHKFNEFYDLCNFLKNEFNMNNSDISMFDDSFVQDYMFSYQIDPEVAKRNLNINLDKYFSKIGFNDKVYICSTIYKLAKNYPSFNYKGHCYNEMKEKVRQ